MGAIADPENLREAFLKAIRGKRGKTDCRAFQERLGENLMLLREDLLAGSVRVGDYHLFQILDPKERTICAASFRQRVLHHAVMAVCEPALERAAVFDSYACRKGKGRLAAVERASGYARRHDWFLKMDVRKYFASIDHRVLEGLLARRYKDRAVLALFGKIIRSYETAPGRGLPIGNLTSQHFANYYLAPLDRFIKEQLGRGAYVRYMDDFVVWGGDREELKVVRDRVREFLAVELKLELKAEPPLNRTALGMDFLGYRLFPRVVRLARRSKNRFARKFRQYERAFDEGVWSEAELQRRITALLAFVMPAASGGFRRHVIERFGVAAIGLEPRDSWWQLEQQRQELPVSEPQQQQPVQQEQQYWVPGCSGPSSTVAPEGALADPAAILSRAEV